MPFLRTLVQGLIGACQVAACVALSPLLRGWYGRWGCAGLIDPARTFPGDEYVPAPRSALTCAVAVDAPAAALWPWLVQLGCGRGGWYSYDLLDNAGRPSAEQILPQFQHLAVGDIVPAVPNGSFGFPVAALQPERALVLAGTLDTRTGKPATAATLGNDPYFSGLQAFVIEPLSPSRCALVFRMRVDWSPGRLNTLIYRFLLEPISFVMGRRMLLTLKQRAQA